MKMPEGVEGHLGAKAQRAKDEDDGFERFHFRKLDFRKSEKSRRLAEKRDGASPRQWKFVHYQEMP
jgi:hypothetical protein